MTTTRNSFEPLKRRKKVIVQTSIPVTDADLNEAQDILLHEAIEGMRANLTTLRSAGSVYQGEMFAAADDWRVSCDPATGVWTVQPGVAYVDGMRLYSDAAQNPTFPGITFPVVAGPPQYAYIYLNVVISEQDGVGDPTIVMPNIGETCKRGTVSLTWGAVTSASSWDDALTSLPALSQYQEYGLVTGYTARVLVAKVYVFYEAGMTNAAVSQVQDLRKPLPGQGLEHIFATMGSSTSPDDSAVLWDSTNSRLSFGFRANGSAPIDTLFSVPGGLRFGHADGTFQHLATMAYPSSADGPAAPFGGYTIPDGYALGFVTVAETGVSPILPQSSLSYRAANGRGTLESPRGPSLAATRDRKLTIDVAAVGDVAILVQFPTIQPVERFIEAFTVGLNTTSQLGTSSVASRGSSFIVCLRQGADLLWWNGRSTKGSTQPVVDSLTHSADKYCAVLSLDGAGSLNRQFALEMLIQLLAKNNALSTNNWVSPVDNSENFGRRVINILLKRGKWILSANVRYVGKSTNRAPVNRSGVQSAAQNFYDDTQAATTNYGFGATQYSMENDNHFSLEGLGWQTSAIVITQPSGAQLLAVGTNAALTVCATRITLKDLSFLNTVGGSNPQAYGLRLVADEIVIENCHFAVPVDLIGNVVVRNSIFAANPIGTGAEFYATNDLDVWENAGANDLKAPHTQLLRVRHGRSHIEGCRFLPRFMRYAQAAVSLPIDRDAVFRDNTFEEYAASLGGFSGYNFSGLVFSANNSTATSPSNLSKRVILVEGNTIIGGHVPKTGTTVSQSTGYADSAGLPHVEGPGKDPVPVGCIGWAGPMADTFAAGGGKVIIRGNTLISSPNNPYGFPIASAPVWANDNFHVWAGMLVQTPLLQNFEFSDNVVRVPEAGVVAYSSKSYTVSYGLHASQSRRTLVPMVVSNCVIKGNYIEADSWMGHAGGVTNAAPAKPSLVEASTLMSIICRATSSTAKMCRGLTVESNTILVNKAPLAIGNSPYASLSANVNGDYLPLMVVSVFDCGDRLNSRSSAFQPAIMSQVNANSWPLDPATGLQGVRYANNYVNAYWLGLSGNYIPNQDIMSAIVGVVFSGLYAAAVEGNTIMFEGGTGYAYHPANVGSFTLTSVSILSGIMPAFSLAFRESAHVVVSSNIFRAIYGVHGPGDSPNNTVYLVGNHWRNNLAGSVNDIIAGRCIEGFPAGTNFKYIT